MDEDWLSTWLENLNLSEYLSNFVNFGYNSSELCCTILAKHELNLIGVCKVGHVNRLFRALEKLRAEAGLTGLGENGLARLEPSNDHLGQSEMGLSTPSVVEGGSGRSSRKPPPVPKRKSTRRKSPSPSPTPPYSSSSDGSEGGRVTPEGSSSLLPPPPIVPRQHSLRHRKKQPSARLRTSTETPSSMMRFGHQELSPIPQSPAVSSGEPTFPLPVSVGLQSQNHQTEQSDDRSCSPPVENCLNVSQVSVEPQRSSPVPRRRAASPLEREVEGGRGGSVPLPPPRVSSNPINSPTDETLSLQSNGGITDEVRSVADEVQGIGIPVVISKPVSPEIARSPEEKAPALPPKRHPHHLPPPKRVVIPDGDVVFELEDIPMPPTPAELNAPSAPLDLPPLPPKGGGIPTFSPPPPPPQATSDDGVIPSLSIQCNLGPPSFPPPTLPTRSPETTLSRTNGRGGPPPALPTRKSTLKPATTSTPPYSPPLPPKNGGVPQFTPPPPRTLAGNEGGNPSLDALVSR